MTDFEAHPFGGSDYDSLRRMLSNFCGKQGFDCPSLVDLIISQKTVGSAIRHAETMYTYGYISAININFHKDKECIQQIKKFVQDSCPENLRDQLNSFIESARFGILLSDRIHNIPHAIAPHIHESTCQEILAERNEANAEFTFDNLLYITNYSFPEKSDTPKKKKNPWRGENLLESRG